MGPPRRVVGTFRPAADCSRTLLTGNRTLLTGGMPLARQTPMTFPDRSHAAVRMYEYVQEAWTQHRAELQAQNDALPELERPWLASRLASTVLEVRLGEADALELPGGDEVAVADRFEQLFSAIAANHRPEWAEAPVIEAVGRFAVWKVKASLVAEHAVIAGWLDKVPALRKSSTLSFRNRGV